MRVMIFRIAMLILLVGSARADVLFHWSFNGPPGQEFISDTDRVSGVILKKFKPAEVVTNIRYDKPNPWYNSKGTSLEFDNDRSFGFHPLGVGLLAEDYGVDTRLDLSTQATFTIEVFIYPYVVEDCAVIKKCDGAGQYGLDLLDNGDIRFTINSNDNFVSAGIGFIKPYT